MPERDVIIALDFSDVGETLSFLDLSERRDRMSKSVWNCSMLKVRL